jgi:cell division protein ZapA
MTGKVHVVRVNIVGEEYAIRSDAPPEHTRAVADYVDRAIRQVMHGSVVEPTKAAILAALQITNELFEANAASEAVTAELDALGVEIRRWLPPAKRGTGAAHATAEGGGA